MVQFAYLLRESDYLEPFVGCFGNQAELERFQDLPWGSGYVVRSEPVKLLDAYQIPPNGQDVYIAFNGWYIMEPDGSYWDSCPVGIGVAVNKDTAYKVVEERGHPTDAVVMRPMGWIHPEVYQFLEPQADKQ